MELKNYIAIREDYPKAGISFKDITPLLMDKDAFEYAINKMIEPYVGKKVDKIICADARGFIFGGAMAYKLHAGLVIARKKGKLPYVGMSESYSLEYGTNELEIAPNAFNEGDKVIVADDLLATGGSACALTNMVNRSKANIIGYSFVIELTGLKGRQLLNDVPVYSLINYEF